MIEGTVSGQRLGGGGEGAGAGDRLNGTVSNGQFSSQEGAIRVNTEKQKINRSKNSGLFYRLLGSLWKPD